MEKLTINKINVSTEYNGRVFTDKRGKRYAKVGVQFTEKGQQWWNALSYNEDDPIRQWRTGNQVEVELEITPDKNDPSKQWYNIKMPRATDEIKARLDKAAKHIQEQDARIQSLENRVLWLEEKVGNLISEAPPAEIL